MIVASKFSEESFVVDDYELIQKYVFFNIIVVVVVVVHTDFLFWWCIIILTQIQLFFADAHLGANFHWYYGM